MFGTFGGKVLAFAPLLLAFLGLLALAWGALASGGVALLLTAGPTVLVALLAWGLVGALAWRRLGQWAWAPWWWAWVPVMGAGAGVAAWWRLTGRTVDGLRAALLEAQRASVAFAAGLVVDGHPAPLELGGYLLGTLPLALVVGTLGAAGWDAWCRVCDRLEEQRLVAERQAADARQQEALRQQEDLRRREEEQRRREALRRQQQRQQAHEAEQQRQRRPVGVAAGDSATQERTREPHVGLAPMSTPMSVWEACSLVEDPGDAHASGR